MISSLNRRRAQRMRALIFTVTILVLGAAPLWAFGRAGGGDHYSGSGGSGGSSSSGGGSSDWGGGYGSSSGPSHYRSGSDVNSPELFLIVFVLVIVILMIAIIFYLLHPTTEAQPDSLILAEGRREARRNLRALRNIDPDLSLVAFTDFSHGLFHAAHVARGEGKLGRYAPYLSTAAQQTLAAVSPHCVRVDHVIVGAWHLVDVSPVEDAQTVIRVRYEANYTERDEDGNERRWYAVETWTYVRDRGVRSKAPAILIALGCPNCGAPLTDHVRRDCASCGETIADGQFNWFVRGIEIHSEERPALSVADDAEDQPDRPVRVDPDFNARVASYLVEHPGFSVEAFLGRVTEVFYLIQRAWSDLAPERLRPFVTDRQFGTFDAWFDEYRAKGLRNRLSEVQILALEPVKLESDRHYTSLTVRIHAAMIDVVVDEQDRLVSGRPNALREFTEYWTFIKGARSRFDGISDLKLCPACGASLSVGMSGVCTHCGSKVTSGDFDWVLSMIEQDESYLG